MFDFDPMLVLIISIVSLYLLALLCLTQKSADSEREHYADVADPPRKPNGASNG